jgi:putative chitinase
MTQFIVSAGKLNFRSSSVIADNIITTLPRGQILEGAQATAGSDWLEVTTIVPTMTGDTKGFVNAQFVVSAQAPKTAARAAGSPTILAEQIQKLAPSGKDMFIDPLVANCISVRQNHGLAVTPVHICHFLAQLAHESAGFRTMREFWGPTKAQIRYEGRKDLGNTQPGDGKRFMGRGYLQITGRANYGSYGTLIGQTLTSMPQLAEDPIVALNIACLYWKNRNIDIPAGKNDIAEVTRRINGGHNGLAERTALFRKAMQIWG